MPKVPLPSITPFLIAHPKVLSSNTKLSVDDTSVLASKKAHSSKGADSIFDGTSDAPVDTPMPQNPSPQLPALALHAGANSKPSLEDTLRTLLSPSLASFGPDSISATSTTFEETILNTLRAVPDDQLMALLSTRFSAQHFSAQKTASENDGHVRLQLGPQFVDVGRLVPGQTRISLDRVREKVAIQIATGGYARTDTEIATPAFGDHTATVPLSRPKPAIAGPNGQVLVIDGNHQAVASILAGAKTTPIDIVADHQDLSPKEFDALSKKMGWTYLNQMGGAPSSIPPTYASLHNDPVRFLMSEVAFKAALDVTTAPTTSDASNVRFEETDRPQTRAWVKLAGKTVDFVEFILADILYTAAKKDPALADALTSSSSSGGNSGEDNSLQERGPAVHRALRAAIDRGELDPQALGILVPAALVTSSIDQAALNIEIAAALS